jgi:hypothetical protein
MWFESSGPNDFEPNIEIRFEQLDDSELIQLIVAWYFFDHSCNRCSPPFRGESVLKGYGDQVRDDFEHVVVM